MVLKTQTFSPAMASGASAALGVAGLFAFLNTMALAQGGSVDVEGMSFQAVLSGQVLSVGLLAIPVAIVLGFREGRRKLAEWMRWGEAGLSLGRFIGIAVILFFALQGLLAVASPAEEQAVVQMLSGITGWERVVMAGMLCAVVPLVEETVFRGILLGALPRKIGLPLSAGAFALAHGLDLYFFPLFFMGWALGLLALRQRALLPGIVLHGLINLFAFLLV